MNKETAQKMWIAWGLFLLASKMVWPPPSRFVKQLTIEKKTGWTEKGRLYYKKITGTISSYPGAWLIARKRENNLAEWFKLDYIWFPHLKTRKNVLSGLEFPPPPKFLVGNESMSHEGIWNAHYAVL